MAICVRNIRTNNYQNLVIGFQVTVKNVEDIFWDTVYKRIAIWPWPPPSSHIQWSNAGPSKGWSREVSYPGPRKVWGAPPSFKNIKCTRMHHFEKKNSKIFSPDGPHENVWGLHKNVYLGPAVALDGPGQTAKNPLSALSAWHCYVNIKRFIKYPWNIQKNLKRKYRTWVPKRFQLPGSVGLRLVQADQAHRLLLCLALWCICQCKCA